MDVGIYKIVALSGDGPADQQTCRPGVRHPATGLITTDAKFSFWCRTISAVIVAFMVAVLEALCSYFRVS